MIVRITSKYGEVSQLHPTGHKGVDIALNEGTPLRSVSDGIVQRVVDLGNENIGKGVIVQLEDGKQAIYGHMSNISVKEGQLIHKGEVIGLSGNTGHSTGPHLHFGMKENGDFIDPTPVVDQTVNQSLWSQFLERGSVANNDYPTIWGYLGEKLLGSGIEHWAADYIMAVPFLVGVSIGVWGLLNMVNSKIATWGVGFVMVLGGIVII
ncbi:M23 family metallopeptidase [Bacillus sp. AFS040349]|uniref:M23 family metallopeptidase n=1 Tax=Bacillus sp. AFS040349 TaxID=2033502 RepID=UPI000BFD0DAB|nr:M23 family metallopeptidase [Bacillus sp. AFS040349]PGT89239.1 hypothetical protein COD11_04365 [Bacillus sp. AFS040349]